MRLLVGFLFVAALSAQVTQTFTKDFGPAPAGATKIGFKWSILCDISKNPPESNLDVNPRFEIFTGTVVSTLMVNKLPICYQTIWLTDTLIPVGIWPNPVRFYTGLPVRPPTVPPTVSNTTFKLEVK